jgi:hypothetical protein
MLVYLSRLDISISHVGTEGHGDGITSWIVRGGIRITQDPGSYLHLSAYPVQSDYVSQATAHIVLNCNVG